MIIYLDFDGTCVEHSYPMMGRYNAGCIEVLVKLQQAGHKIILNTYRVDISQESLEQALKWFTNFWMFVPEGIELQPITEFTPSKIEPAPWMEIYNDSIFIDDIAANIPLIEARMESNWMVNWKLIEKDLINNKII